MAAPRGNQAIAGRNPFSWEEFHALPRQLRDILNYAPVELGSHRAYEALMAGSLLGQVIRQELTLVQHFTGQHVLLSYGPDHPQAPGRSTSAPA